MEPANRYDGIDPRVVRSIRHYARCLARRGAAPGMDVVDYEQDLALDLLRRQPAFDPARSSFPTFADRVLRHRVATLTSPTLRRTMERRTESLDAVGGDNGEQSPLLDLLPDEREGASTGDATDLVIDTISFVGSLSPVLRRYCDVLAADNISAAARAAGLSRSSIYEVARRLRDIATARGLAIYIAGQSGGPAFMPANAGSAS